MKNKTSISGGGGGGEALPYALERKKSSLPPLSSLLVVQDGGGGIQRGASLFALFFWTSLHPGETYFQSLFTESFPAVDFERGSMEVMRSVLLLFLK